MSLGYTAKQLETENVENVEVSTDRGFRNEFRAKPKTLKESCLSHKIAIFYTA